jgi:hypothetical protein
MRFFSTISALHIQPAGYDQLFEELPVAQDWQAVAAAGLVPLSEPEQGHDFLCGKAALHKLLAFRGVYLQVCFCYELFFSLDRLIHIHVPPTKARPLAPSCH